jgi:hypothetical protein
MQKSQVDSLTLVLAALAGALALTQISGPFAWMSSIAGLALLLILLAFDQEGYRTVFQSLAFSAVCGFCTAIAAGILFQLLANHGEVHLANGQWASGYLPLTCAFATAIFWAIDLMRMNARKVAPIRVPRALGETRMFPDASAPVSYVPPQPVAAPPPVDQQPAYHHMQAAEPAPTAAPEPAFVPTQPIIPPPAAPAPARPASTATSIFSVPSNAVPASAPAPVNPAPAPMHPGPAPIVPRSGKETMIYVSLLNEGLNVLRSVRAEPLGRDYYRIIDDMPSGETWQFQPGQVVRCKKQNLSSGKAMVAIEEAQRAT